MKIRLETNEKSIRSEAKRLIFSYDQLRSGFYGAKRLIILPRETDQNSAVYFPELDYSEIKKIFDKNNTDKYEPENDKEILDEMVKQIETNEIEITKKQFSDIDLKKLIKQIETTLSKVLVNTPKVMKLTIYETDYGTRMSFGRLHKEKNGAVKMRIFIRSDCDIRSIVTGILMSIIADNKYKDEKGDRYWQDEWEINQSIADYLMRNSLISNLYPEYNSFLESLQEDIEQGEYVLESMDYYSRLGYPINSVLVEKGKSIYFDDIDLTTVLTPTERRTLRCFIKNRGGVCSYDQLSDAIWRERSSEKFSLWAIAKAVQNVRNKLSEVGAPHNLIQTKRKEGYILFD